MEGRASRMMALKLSLLGPFSASVEGKEVRAFESDKVRALLAYLATEANLPHRREALSSLLWPDRPEVTARHNLNQAVYNLRHVLAGEGEAAPQILTMPEGLQFCPGASDWLDVAVFRQLVERCERHPHDPGSACKECKNWLEQAAALYRGEFLADLALKDSLPFEEWSTVTREHLRLQMQTVLQTLAATCEQLGDWARALAAAWRMVEMDPLWEAGVRQLMRLLDRRGQRSAALAQYERLRKSLEDELGVEPETSTQGLAQRLRAQASGQKPPNNLPASLTPFVGRNSELAALQDCLRDTNCRLLTLLGPGGAVKLAWRWRLPTPCWATFPMGCTWCRLTRCAQPRHYPPRWQKR